MRAVAGAATGSRRGGPVIGIDARLLSGRQGGVEQYVIGLATGLSGLADGDEEYRFLVYPGAGDWLAPYVSGPATLVEAAAGPPAEHWSARVRGRIGAALPLVRRGWRAVAMRRIGAAHRDGDALLPDDAMAAAGAQLVHFPFQRGFRTELPSIYQPWDLQHRHLPGFFSPSTIRWREATYRALCEQARLVITASEWTKRDVAASYGIPGDRIAVVNVPPPLTAYAAPAREELPRIAAALHLPSRFLLYPAQAWPHKNHARLFAALARTRRRGVDVHLVLTGSAIDGRRRLESEARRHGVEGQVTSVGFVEPSVLHAIYLLADGLVFPSLFEGWGLPIVEAFAARLPVACSNVTSLPELVGDAALIFEPTDVDAIAASMTTLWTDDGRRAELAERGWQRVRGLTWPATARLLRAHYRRVLGNSLAPEDEQLLQQASMA